MFGLSVTNYLVKIKEISAKKGFMAVSGKCMLDFEKMYSAKDICVYIYNIQ